MILWMYLLRRFLWIWFMVTMVFVGLLFPIDVMEQVRKLGEMGNGIGDGTRLALLNLPAALYQLQPLIVILATIALFVGLARSSELVVIRASGRSLVRSLQAPMAGALILGILGLLVLNPIVAATQQAYERAVADLRPGTSNVLSLAGEGVWMRQGDGAGQTVIRAARSSLDGTILYSAMFLQFDAEGTPTQRIEARRAALRDGAWQLHGAKFWPLATSRNPERDAARIPYAELPSNLTVNQIRDSFGTPSAIPIFSLPIFIKRLDEAGFSARLHRMWFAIEVANPILLVAMVMVGAGFTMRHARAGRTGVMVLIALLVGFAIFFLRNFAQVMGENGQLPIMVAALAPPLAGVALAMGMLLHMEDG